MESGASMNGVTPDQSIEKISTRYKCEPPSSIRIPAFGKRPPDLYAYPKAERKVQLLFVVWNPPKPFGGFWSLEFDDNLRSELHRVLVELKKIKASTPDATFLDEFLKTGFYFIHAVKCWCCAKYPGFGRGAKEMDRKRMGLPLLRACVDAHLRDELRDLSPEKVCLLGKLPYTALSCISERLGRMKVTPTEGKVLEPQDSGFDWPILYSCFPGSQKPPRSILNQRELLRRDLESFLG